MRSLHPNTSCSHLLIREPGSKGSLMSALLHSKFSSEDVEVKARDRCYDGFLPIDLLQLKHSLFAGGWSELVQRELLVKPEAVGILLYDPDRDEVVMVRQFRVGLLDQTESPWLLELVAGMVGDGEELEQVAIRESREEADCTPTNLIRIGSYYSSPGASNEKVTLFCGRVDASAAGGVFGLAEEHEDIEVVVLPRANALAAVHDGSINNAMSIIALQWLELRGQEVLRRWK